MIQYYTLNSVPLITRSILIQHVVNYNLREDAYTPVPLTARFGSSQRKSIESNIEDFSTISLIDLRIDVKARKFLSFSLERRSRMMPLSQELLFRKHYEKFACEDLSNGNVTEFCGIVRGLGLSSRELERGWCFLSWILWYVRVNCLNTGRGYVRVGEWRMRNSFF